MRQDKLLITDGVLIRKDFGLPDLSLSSGDVLWLETENELQADVFISFMLGLLDVKKGKAFIGGSSIKESTRKTISYIDLSMWNPKMDSLEDLVKLLAYDNGFQVSAVMNEFKRLLSGLGTVYATDMNFDEMSIGTKRIVSSAISLAMPQLIIMLVEPFMNLDKDSIFFMEQEIKRIALDGTSIIILSDTQPPVYSEHKAMRLPS